MQQKNYAMTTICFILLLVFSFFPALTKGNNEAKNMNRMKDRTILTDYRTFKVSEQNRKGSTNLPNMDIDLYPNPSNQIINIKVQCIDDIRVEITDLYGNVINECNITKMSLASISLDVSSLRCGFYRLSVYNEKKLINRTIDFIKN